MQVELHPTMDVKGCMPAKIESANMGHQDQMAELQRRHLKSTLTVLILVSMLVLSQAILSATPPDLLEKSPSRRKLLPGQRP